MTQGGPQTSGGKSVSRWNSSKHGLRSNSPVVPGLEETEDWEAHLNGVLQSLGPEGHLEQVLAERVALQSWRLHRVTRYEREAVALAQESVEENFHEAERDASLRVREASKDHFERASRIRDFMGQLMSLEEEKRVASRLAAETVDRAYSCVESVVTEDISHMELPGIPRTVTDNDLSLFSNWTAGLVRGAIGAYAERAGRSSEDLLREIEEAEQAEVDQAKVDLEYKQREMESRLDRLHRERLLPDGKTLEKIARYEAHISRQMYQALHELEALQTRRGGGNAPLGRLDVQGVPET